MGVFQRGFIGGPSLLWGGGCLYFSYSNYFFFKSVLGSGTNNYAELMALKLLLMFVIEKGARSLQVFSDFDNYELGK